jgi:hypothetical protein
MAALVAAIHNHDLDRLFRTMIMDGRDKPGHDALRAARFLRGFAASRESFFAWSFPAMTMTINPPPRLRGSACQFSFSSSH